MILQVGVKVFLKNANGKYLFIKRSSKKYKAAKGNWDIVGGRIEPGSTLMDNLRREVKEETALEIVNDPALIYAQDIISNEERHVIRLSYAGETAGKPILDTNENIEYKWLSLEEIINHEDVDIYVMEILSKGLLK